MRFFALALLATAACTIPPEDGDSSLFLDTEQWTAGAIFSDRLELPSITISLAFETDADACSWYAPRSVEISLPVDSRDRPHVLPSFRVDDRVTGAVYYTDDDQDVQPGASGYVWPTQTGWNADPVTGQFDRIASVEGELDVLLQDGRRLTGTFRAKRCARD